MKKILYPTDYSENSVSALTYAFEVARQLNAQLNVLHVYDYPTVLQTKVSEPFPDLAKDAYREHMKKLEDFLSRNLAKSQKRVPLHAMVMEHRSVVGGIIKEARESKADLVIAGMKGGSGLRESIMGSIARGLIEKSPCPVLTIPPDSSYNSIKTFVYGATVEHADKAVLRQLVTFAKPFKAIIKVVHISSANNVESESGIRQVIESLKQEMHYEGIDYASLVSENVFDALRIYAGDENADILVMLEHKARPFVESLFHRDLVKKMEAYGRIPLLAYNQNSLKL